MKNKLILFYGYGSNKEKIVLNNIRRFKHILIYGKSYIMVEIEDGKRFKYKTQFVVISEFIDFTITGKDITKNETNE